MPGRNQPVERISEPMIEIGQLLAPTACRRGIRTDYLDPENRENLGEIEFAVNALVSDLLVGFPVTRNARYSRLVTS
jgi:hypothetical protein